MPFERDALRARLAAPIDGGRHGRRADRTIPGQMSLFESVRFEDDGRALEGSAETPALGSDSTRLLTPGKTA